MDFSVEPANFFVTAPFQELQNTLLDLFIAHDLQPEIGLEGDILYSKSPDDFQQVAAMLESQGLNCTLHAPFFDLNPGALDPHIRQASRNKLRLAFDLIPIFKPKAIVCHLNYESNKHSYKYHSWFQHAKETWQTLLQLAKQHQTPIVLENTYETNPTQHILMLEALNSPFCQFCLDTGHLQSFAATTWQVWETIINRNLSHMHLHDNCGDRDSHLSVGRGNFDFSGLFSHLARHKISPTVTIEPHSLDDLWVSLKNLNDMGVITR